MKPILIAFTGTDGSGKSSLLSGLQKKLSATGDSVVVASIWDGLIQNREALGLDPRKIDHYLSVLSIPARAHFLMHAWWQSLSMAQSKNPKWILLDGYWYKYLASEEARSIQQKSGDQFRVKNLGAAFPPPDRIFWIDTPLEVCASRKSKFSGYETNYQGQNAETFLRFQKPVTQIHREWIQELSPTVLNGEQALETLVDSCFDGLWNKNTSAS